MKFKQYILGCLMAVGVGVMVSGGVFAMERFDEPYDDLVTTLLRNSDSLMGFLGERYKQIHVHFEHETSVDHAAAVYRGLLVNKFNHEEIEEQSSCWARELERVNSLCLAKEMRHASALHEILQSLAIKIRERIVVCQRALEATPAPRPGIVSRGFSSVVGWASNLDPRKLWRSKEKPKED